MSDRIEIRTGVTGDAQESSFMNATLQSVERTGADGTRELANLAFSIAVYVGVDGDNITSEDELASHLRDVLAPLVVQPGVKVEIELGPEREDEDDADEDDADAEAHAARRDDSERPPLLFFRVIDG